ncbi:MAG: serine hydrolase domain-containing protein [Pseudomonadota bacterium]
MKTCQHWLALGAAAFLVACGGDDTSSDVPEAQDLETTETETGPTRLAPALISTGWPDTDAPVVPEQIGMTANGIEEFRGAITAAVNERGAAGMTALLVRDGHVASFVSAGMMPAGDAPAGNSTVWRAPALTAPVISTGLLMLYDEGQFSLDEPAAYYLPEGRLGPAGTEEQGPTIAQLMAGDGTADPDLRLQAEVIEYISGEPVDVYLDNRIFEPLGMMSMRVMAGDNPDDLTLEASLRDMARFTQMLASGGNLGGARILDGGTVATMATDHLPDDRWALNSGLGEDMTPGVLGRGLGVAVLRSAGVTGPGATQGSFFAAGEGSFFLVDRDQGLVLVGLSEGTGGRDGDADVLRAAASAAYGALATE